MTRSCNCHLPIEFFFSLTEEYNNMLSYCRQASDKWTTDNWTCLCLNNKRKMPCAIWFEVKKIGIMNKDRRERWIVHGERPDSKLVLIIENKKHFIPLIWQDFPRSRWHEFTEKSWLFTKFVRKNLRGLETKGLVKKISSLPSYSDE